MHQIADLISIFERTFYQSHNTCLIKGDFEPVYLPATEHVPYHQVVFAHGFYASALHEVAHWLVAGDARRLLEDFGYWYMPDGRDAEQQKTFERVEIKPQAIEWAFSVAAGKKFNVSADNLNGAAADTITFKENVFQQVQQYLHQGFPVRAQAFIDALANFYNVSLPLNITQFSANATFNHSETVTHV